jgi:uncharacterized membrane protein YfcA
MVWLQRFLATTLFGSLPIYLGSCGALFVAFAVYVMFGFGVGLIAVGAMAMLLEQVTDVVVLLLLLNLPLELLVVYRSRKEITWRGVLLICGGIAVGVPLGTVALGWGEAGFILTLLGAFLVVAGTLFLLLPNAEGPGINWPAWVGPLAGLTGGVLGGLFGTSGPPLILYFRLAGVDKGAFRGNLMAIFLLITMVRLPSYGVAGLITLDRAVAAALVTPALVLGGLVGDRIHLKVREVTFQRLVAVALLLIGVLLLLR